MTGSKKPEKIYAGLSTARRQRRRRGWLSLATSSRKISKGYLLGKGWLLKRTHDLEVLLNEAMTHDERFQNYLDVCIMVREFYVEESKLATCSRYCIV